MQIIGHRGASKDKPENTLAAFREAFAQGADAIEFDVYQHHNESFVFHDRYLHRTTNGKGRFIDTSPATIRQLDAGQGQSIPRLDEALQCMVPGTWCNIELKFVYDVPSWLNNLDHAITHSGITADRLLISSFNHHYLDSIKKCRPYLKVGALTASYSSLSIQEALAIDAYSLHVALDVISPQYVNAAQQAGLKVYVYTVDGKQDIQELALWGVDGIFTNVPYFARSVLQTP